MPFSKPWVNFPAAKCSGVANLQRTVLIRLGRESKSDNGTTTKTSEVRSGIGDVKENQQRCLNFWWAIGTRNSLVYLIVSTNNIFNRLMPSGTGKREDLNSTSFLIKSLHGPGPTDGRYPRLKQQGPFHVPGNPPPSRNPATLSEAAVASSSH
ncbi:hypothetical protein pipiens_002085 [Culex pipiens pipiens]|uniref:Uncharacterized protein n=1 Tax=Culex pipiens pipiens TaxID=38569 RepID=A0ABD1DKJ9_CULPP